MDELYADGGQIPRLTAAIVAHSRLRRDGESEDKADRQKATRSPYNDLRAAIEARSPELPALFTRLEHIARDFAALGGSEGESPNTVPLSWLTLLWIFRRNSSGSVSAQESRQRPMMERAAKVVDQMKLLVGETDFGAILAAGPRVKHLEFLEPDKRVRKGRGSDFLDMGSHIQKAWMTDTDLGSEFEPGVKCKGIKREHLANFSSQGPNQPLRINQFQSAEAEATAAGLKAVAESIAPNAGSSRETGRRFGLSMVTLMEELSSMFSDADALVRSLFDKLCSPASDDEIQAELVDLLGFERLELLGQIIQSRSQLVKEYRQAVPSSSTKLVPLHEVQKVQEIGARPGGKPKKAPPMAGQMITVQSESEKQAAKELRKEWKKAAKVKGPAALDEETLDIDAVRARELALEEAASAPIFASQVVGMHAALGPTSKYPFVFDALAERKSTISLSTTLMVPEGTINKSHRNYQEITIPAPIKASNIGGNRVRISELDDLAQTAFRGAKELNQIQSIVYPAAYESDENLLICAPTGAGKTNVAMLTVLNVVKRFMDGRRLDRNAFKIVYVAPMKALAAEMTRNFGARLAPIGVTVKELTGDTSLTKAEIANTQMLVVTPEKWDVVTRKGTGDLELVGKLCLLIIDEVHLLHDDRGPVIETIVARALRQVEMTQKRVRVVGLSATLPNYIDVARFLHVDPFKGLFFFDGRFRPVPLTQTFIGVKSSGSAPPNVALDEICYEKVVEFLRDGHQVLVFVHARNATGKLAATLKEMASVRGTSSLFLPEQNASYLAAQKSAGAAKSGQVRDLFPAGLGIHHAGLPRPDRHLTERLFEQGHIRVLCCTATLAWGVNLPAHGVIIRGTEIYDAKQGSFVDVGILDVQQIFGRAGRPQFDTSGHGVIITAQDKLQRYVSLMSRATPIESQFINSLEDNLNAEIALGTVTNVDEAIQWIAHTYLFVRVRLNPLAYGLNFKRQQEDPDLYNFRKELIEAAAEKLDQFEMIRYDARQQLFFSTDTGRIASHFYIKANTVETLLHDDQRALSEHMTDEEILCLVAKSSEFHQLKVRDEELNELDNLVGNYTRLRVGGGSENVDGKVNVLLQAHLSRAPINGFSLLSDSLYILQNATRIIRALFEISLRRAWSITTGALLRMAKAVEQQLWPDGYDSPLWQFIKIGMLTYEEVRKVEAKHLTLDQLRELEAKELTGMLRVKGERVKTAVETLPNLDIAVSVRPITATVLQLELRVEAAFSWHQRVHGSGNECFFIWVENPEDTVIYHHEYFLLHRRQVQQGEVQKLSFAIPIKESAIPSQYIVRWSSERWVGSEGSVPVSFRHLILPRDKSKHTGIPLHFSIPIQMEQ